MIDHLVYAAPDLDEGTDAIAGLLGVRPSPGGRHAGFGTHNALLSLGKRTYLEVIARDPSQPEPQRPRPFGLDAITGPRLVTWAASAPDIEERVIRARAAGYDPGDVFTMGRDTPDGGRLSWRIALPPHPAGDGLVPFLIDFGKSPHPEEALPRSCTLAQLSGEHPEPAAVQRILKMIGAELAIVPAREPALVAEIDTPKGRVELR